MILAIKLSKGETVSMRILMKVRKTLNCDIRNIRKLISSQEGIVE